MKAQKEISRSSQIETLKKEKFDIVIVGAGATGAGAALDAALRGLKVALIDRGDFAGGTSSKSTKLVHGGVRYLEKAVKGFDYTQFDLVRGALRERQTLIKLAPHLVRKIGLITPVYTAWEVPYMLIGLKMYDFISGKASFGKSQYLSPKETAKRFPQVKTKGLRGGILYYDGQFDDARMNVELVLSAHAAGASVCNYLEVKSLEKSGESVTGVKVSDRIGNEEFIINSELVINATGPYADALRRMDNPDCDPLLQVSSGAHIVVDSEVCPRDLGMLIPKTSDGRVLFVLPWRGHTIIGTTDEAAKVVDDPVATQVEVDYIIEHINLYLGTQITRENVLSDWSGLRPLVRASSEGKSTASLSRDHHISVSPSGLITITGGKWTTYRLMAADVINKSIECGSFKDLKECCTNSTPLVGAVEELPEVKDLSAEFNLEEEVASHLISTYGVRSRLIGKMAKEGAHARISEYFPIIEAEVKYANAYELVTSPEDFLARRVRASFTNRAEAEKMSEKVASLL